MWGVEQKQLCQISVRSLSVRNLDFWSCYSVVDSWLNGFWHQAKQFLEAIPSQSFCCYLAAAAGSEQCSGHPSDWSEPGPFGGRPFPCLPQGTYGVPWMYPKPLKLNPEFLEIKLCFLLLKVQQRGESLCSYS